ncbi:MAG: tetratricopeptide repeat protein [Verrucomicrobia bacterium]|nr:tetratricopeptide repeat protein [Verrucomicrobiota bacterium]
MARLAIPGVVFIGVVLGGSWWFRREPSRAPGPSKEHNVTPAAEPIKLGPSGVQGGAASRPEVEATALKQEAVAVAGQVAEAYPNDALAYALLGSAYYNTGRSEAAAKHLQKCLELRPDRVEAYEILARVAYEKGDLEETVRLCQEALKRGPVTGDVLNRLGRAQMDLGRTEEAVRTLQQAVGLPELASESCYLFGQAHMQSGNFAQAKEGFRRSIELMPNHTQAYFGLYTACLRLGQNEEAARYREQFVKLEAVDRKDLTDRSAQEDTLNGLQMVRETVARTLFGAAQIHHVHEHHEKAAGLFRRSAVLDPDNPMYRAALEAFYVKRNELAAGAEVFHQLVIEQPRNSLNHFFLGRLQGRLEEFDAAERSYQKVKELTPDWSEGYRALAELYLRANRKTVEAQSLARKAIEFEPSGSNYYILAVACWRNNDRPGALEAVKKALALSPDETTYQQLFQQLQSTP